MGLPGRQLRPKINNYELTVEKGDGYDLNRSLFERLVIEGHPYRTLSKQHRMRPEISALVRHLTYPDLTDGPRTESRPPIRGLQNTVIFIDHQHPEDDDSSLSDPKHLGVTTSKKNKFEVDMVVKIVRYLKQQGYGSGEMTILTPYLGQLILLREALETTGKVMFGERDTELLEVAGLAELLSTLGLVDKKKQALKVSTIGEVPRLRDGSLLTSSGFIDNYQGEENDIIIASLTRSNEEGNIGFMSSPERLNVLLSRARMGLILIGNSETFLKSRSGGELWTKFFDMIKPLGYFYEGLPVQCEQHDDVKNVLRLPEDFVNLCPDGGCSESWFVLFLVLVNSADRYNSWLCSAIAMSCGVHICPRKCHRRQDHQDLACVVKLRTELPCGHSFSRRCHQSQDLPEACAACKLAQRKAAPEEEAGTEERHSVSVDSRPSTPSTPSWRDLRTSPTTDNRIWRTGRSTNSSTNVFDMYRGTRRSTDTYKDGLFNKARPQFDSVFTSGRGSGRGSWRR